MKLSKKSQKLIDTNPEEVKAKSIKHLNAKWIVIAIGFIIGLLLAGGTSFFIYDTKIKSERQSQLNELTQQRADLVGGALQNYFDNIIEQASFLAGQAALREAILVENKRVISEVKDNIKRQIEHVQHVNIYARGAAKLDPDAIPPLRFSELALIQDAEKGEKPRPEAVKLDNNWRLNVVVPSRESGEANVVGVLWITVSIDALNPILEKANENLGQVELFQSFSPNNRFRVTQIGAASFDNEAVYKLNESQWEIQFTAGEALVERTHVETIFVYIMISALSLLFIIGFTVVAFFVGSKLEVSAQRKLIERQMRGGSSSPTLSDGLGDVSYSATNILDVEVSADDEDLLGIEDDEPEAPISEALNLDDDVFEIDENEPESGFLKEIFRAYDIRGLANEQIDKEFALCLGQALGTELQEQRENTLVVARDARTHSPQLTEWLVRGVLSTGCNVLNIGTVPTPLMYFTIETMDEVTSGVMVTASHNGAKYNGFKLVMNGVSRSGEDIQVIRRKMNAKKFLQGQGQEHHHDIIPNYIDTIFSDVALAGEVSVVIDAGNGVAGKVAPRLFSELGCRVTPLYCDLDGTFPNHDPDPSVESNLKDLVEKVKQERADIGIALDGDGDRLAVVSGSGKIYSADRLLMLFATDIISRTPGADVIFDVKSTRHLNSCIANCGGRPVMWKTGHSLMKQKMQETGAVVGAEYSGHIFIKDRWFGFDDGMYAAARLLEILSLQGESIDEAFSAYPESVSTPEIRVPIEDSRKFELIESLKEKADFGEGRLTLLDGVRADYSFGWGLVRASNTGAELTMRFEADNEESLHTLKSIFVKALREVDNSISVNWNQ